MCKYNPIKFLLLLLLVRHVNKPRISPFQVLLQGVASAPLTAAGYVEVIQVKPFPAGK